MNLNFEKTWWIKWYWPFIEELYVEEGHFGTRWSAKSHNIARKLLYHTFQPYQFNVLQCRKVYGEIEGSTHKLLTTLITNHFPNDFTVRKDHFLIVNKHTGNWIRGLGMDKGENAKAVEGANIAWMEEANQFTQEDRDYIDTTIRGDGSAPISLIMSWNPEKKNHWLYDEYESKKDLPGHLFRKSTFWENYTINREVFHEKLLRIKNRGPEGEKRYKVWALGDWGVEDLDSTFAYSFDQSLHVYEGRVPLIPGFPIYLSFDFNVTNTCGVQQFALSRPSEKYYAVINRVATHRIGDLAALCETLQSQYPGHEFIVNGDASGANRSALTKDNISAYKMIQSYLKIEDTRLQVPRFNPSHIDSRTLTNIVFQRCNIQIGRDGNEILITDLKEAEVDRNGSLDPWKTKNPNKSHALDEFRYFIYKNFRDIAKQYTL